MNWFDAKDPRADYYRYLPSFYEETNPGLFAQRQELWRTDENARQIDWDQLYFANGKNLYSVQNANGIIGNTVTGNRSKYIVEEQRADPSRIGLNSVYNKELDNGRHVTYGGSFNHQRTHYFNTVSDLLGGDFWVDIDQFADRDFNDTFISQNDLDRPNKIVEVGDVRLGLLHEHPPDHRVRPIREEVANGGSLHRCIHRPDRFLARRQRAERSFPGDLQRQG